MYRRHAEDRATKAQKGQTDRKKRGCIKQIMPFPIAPATPTTTHQTAHHTRCRSIQTHAPNKKPIPYCCMAAASANPEATAALHTDTPAEEEGERKGERGRENEEARGRKEGVGSR